MDRIKAMLEACRGGQARLPADRLVWRAMAAPGHHRLVRAARRRPLPDVARPGARWFSEAWLPPPSCRAIGATSSASRGPTPTPRSATSGSATPGSSGLTLQPDARQFVLARGQAVQPALLRRQERPVLRPGREERRLHGRGPPPGGPRAVELDDLAFLILAPQARIDDGVFARDTALESIRGKARRRVEPVQRRARRLAHRLVRADPRPRRHPLPGLGRGDRDDRLPRPRHRPGHRRLLRQMPPLQPTHPASRLPGPRTGANRPWKPDPRRDLALAVQPPAVGADRELATLGPTVVVPPGI